MRLRFYTLMASILMLAGLTAQTTLHDNGPLINSEGTGVGGADESVLQTLSLNMNIFGFGIQNVFDNWVLDDFTIPEGRSWDIETITFYGYQTNADLTVSPFSGAHVRIWDGEPGLADSEIIWGNMTDNLLIGSSSTGIYRVTETSTGTNTQRLIWTLEAEIGINLPEGTYWLEYAASGNGVNSGPWAPPITINGQSVTGNAIRTVNGGISYFPVEDNGGNGFFQGFPFLVDGELGLPTPWRTEKGHVGCEEGEADYDYETATFSLTATACFYSNPFNADQMTFVQQTLCGDGEIITQVSSIEGQGWAGLQMRETMDVGSKKFALSNNGSNFVRREARSQTNGYAFPQQLPAFGKSWLKIVRSGNQFRGYVSSNGHFWQLVMVANITMEDCIEMGLFVTNLMPNTSFNAQFENTSTSIEDAAKPSPSDNLLAKQKATTDQTVSLYPNPTRDIIHLELPNYQEQVIRIELMDMLGRPVQTVHDEMLQESRQRINLESYPAGTYYLQIMGKEGILHIQQIVKI